MKLILRSIQTIIIIIGIIAFTNNDFKKIETTVINNNLHKKVDLDMMALKVQEYHHDDLYSAKESYTGDLTGYVYNCPACTGRLACKGDLDLSNGTITYEDNEYGTLNIVASSSNLPCGTVIKFSYPKISNEEIYAIVLDRGVNGNAIDFLSESYDYAVSSVGRGTINYDVLRRGFSEDAQS